jgi:hypothetical protein
VTYGGRVIQEISYNYESAGKLNSLNVDVNVVAQARFAKLVGDK